MTRRNALYALFLAGGCASSVPSANDIPGGIVAAVSGDQRYIAYLVAPSGSPPTGSLWVKPLAGGPAIHLADRAYDPSFGSSGHALFFLDTPTTAARGGYAGHLQLWTPGLGAPVRLTNGYDNAWAQPPDYSVDLFVESPVPGDLSNASVRLLRTGDCVSPSSCAPTRLASGVTVRDLTVSRDGRFGAYVVEAVVSGAATLTTYALRTADGRPVQVARTPLPWLNVATHALVAFSPDGRRLAVMSTEGALPLRPAVIDTSTFAPVAWSTIPSPLQATDLTFSDADTLFVETVYMVTPRAVYRTNAASAEMFEQATYFLIRHNVDGAERYLFFNHATDADNASRAPIAWIMVDLQTRSRMQLTRSGTAPFMSDDLARVAYLDDVDPQTRVGTLTVAALPTGTPQVVERSVYAGGVSFARGTHTLLYFGSHVSGAAGAPLFRWTDGRHAMIEGSAYNYVTAPAPPAAYATRISPSGTATIVRHPIE